MPSAYEGTDIIIRQSRISYHNSDISLKTTATKPTALPLALNFYSGLFTAPVRSKIILKGVSEIPTTFDKRLWINLNS